MVEIFRGVGSPSGRKKYGLVGFLWPPLRQLWAPLCEFSCLSVTTIESEGIAQWHWILSKMFDSLFQETKLTSGMMRTQWTNWGQSTLGRWNRWMAARRQRWSGPRHTWSALLRRGKAWGRPLRPRRGSPWGQTRGGPKREGDDVFFNREDQNLI